MQTGKKGIIQMNISQEELSRLENIVSGFEITNIKDINNIKNLKFAKITTDELLKLINMAKENDKKALNILVKYYFPFIATLALNYYVDGTDLEDLVMAAVVGFIEGIKRFQSGNINNWVYFYIRKSINKEISLEFTSAKIGDNFDYVVFLYLKYLEDLKAGRISLLTDFQLASKFGVDVKGIKRVRDLVNKDNVNNINVSIEDMKIGDNNYYGKNDIIKIIDKYLPSNYRDIFKMYYGFLGPEPLTQREIAKIINVSPTRVDEILKKCMFILSSTTAKRKLREYYYDDCLEQHYRLSKRSIEELKGPIKRILYSKRSNGMITK